jgi:hypothetical protein
VDHFSLENHINGLLTCYRDVMRRRPDPVSALA